MTSQWIQVLFKQGRVCWRAWQPNWPEAQHCTVGIPPIGLKRQQDDPRSSSYYSPSFHWSAPWIRVKDKSFEAPSHSVSERRTRVVQSEFLKSTSGQSNDHIIVEALCSKPSFWNVVRICHCWKPKFLLSMTPLTPHASLLSFHDLSDNSALVTDILSSATSVEAVPSAQTDTDTAGRTFSVGHTVRKTMWNRRWSESSQEGQRVTDCMVIEHWILTPVTESEDYVPCKLISLGSSTK